MSHNALTTYQYQGHHRKNDPPENPFREIEVLIISAENLKNVQHVTRMKPCGVVYVEKDHVARTHVNHHGGTNRTWNETVVVKFGNQLLESDAMAALNADIYASRSRVGEANRSARVLLCDVLKGGKPDEQVDNPIQCMTVQVWRPSVKNHGLLNLWCLLRVGS